MTIFHPDGRHDPTPEPIEQLRELARQLHADGMKPLQLAMEVLRLNCQLGRPVQAAAEIVRQLPGLETFDVVKAWQQWSNDPAVQKELDRRWKASPEYVAAEADALREKCEQQDAERRKAERKAAYFIGYAETRRRRDGEGREKVLAEIQNMNAQFMGPPLPDHQINAIVNGAFYDRPRRLPETVDEMLASVIERLVERPDVARMLAEALHRAGGPPRG